MAREKGQDPQKLVEEMHDAATAAGFCRAAVDPERVKMHPSEARCTPGQLVRWARAAGAPNPKFTRLDIQLWLLIAL